MWAIGCRTCQHEITKTKNDKPRRSANIINKYKNRNKDIDVTIWDLQVLFGWLSAK